jgi:uncharacterized protein with PQ loop repeat
VSPFWIVGVLGMVSMEASYLPQIVRLHRLKRAEEVSIFFPAMSLVGRLLALTYALFASQSLFSIGFCVGIALRATLLGQTYWYRFGRDVLARWRRGSLPKSAVPVTEGRS